MCERDPPVRAQPTRSGITMSLAATRERRVRTSVKLADYETEGEPAVYAFPLPSVMELCTRFQDASC